MSDIPHMVLSEHFREMMSGRRLRSAIFLTYQFDPAFFEQQILPVFIDVPLSDVVDIRVVQLEDRLRSIIGEIAVYYDANGLIRSETGSAKLDIRRIPIHHYTGIFHPKNILLLVEEAEPDDEGYHARSLLVASMSANLTQTGWWENVEVCHVEEITEGEKNRLKDDLIDFLETIRSKTAQKTPQKAIAEVLSFLRDVEPRFQRSTAGLLHTHFYNGSVPVDEFLAQITGNLLKGAYLEIISPFFDDAASSRPLKALIDRFDPKEVRIFLPRSRNGQAQCRLDLYDSIKRLNNVQWGRLPKERIRAGRNDDAIDRFVHAKVYRFFTQNPKQEFLFIGSANLTTAAHQNGGNIESGFLVELEPPHRPDFWLEVDNRRPTEFMKAEAIEVDAALSGTRLLIRYHWDRAVAEVFWDSPKKSPEMRIEARGIAVGSIGPLPAREWTLLTSELGEKIKEFLAETSYCTIHGDGDTPCLLLVQEEGMSHKPSLILQLSPADILHYWSLLTPEQRTLFLESVAPLKTQIGIGGELITQGHATSVNIDTIFDRFAGVFHAFGCLERTIRQSLDDRNERDVEYRLFGRKYDSLNCLLERIATQDSIKDDIDHYVIISSAKQLCHEIQQDYQEFWLRHSVDAREIEQHFQELVGIRSRIIEQNPAEMKPFMDWFDLWFMQRAKPIVVRSS